jgi:hypothetical protein
MDRGIGIPAYEMIENDESERTRFEKATLQRHFSGAMSSGLDSKSHFH